MKAIFYQNETQGKQDLAVKFTAGWPAQDSLDSQSFSVNVPEGYSYDSHNRELKDMLGIPCDLISEEDGFWIVPSSSKQRTVFVHVRKKMGGDGLIGTAEERD